MRSSLLPLLGALCLVPLAHAQVPPETASVATLAAPTPGWVMAKTSRGAYIFDGDSGEMQGLITNETGYFSPAIVTVMQRKEAYLVESFYSRGVTGDRSDVLTVVDMSTLATKAEIDIPDRAAALEFRNHIGIMGDDRLLALFNQTPAQSVSIVDVVERKFVSEIPVPGCAVIMPTGERAFMVICGDGRLQLIELDEHGNEARRSRSAEFFSVEKDAVFDQPVKTRDGWALVSREGLVYTVSVQGSQITVAKPWPMQPADAAAPVDGSKTWRPGGRQVFTIHRDSGLLYALMHEGPIDTHTARGTQVWVIDLQRKRRVATLELETPASLVLASQEARPKLYVYDTKDELQVYDGLLLKKLRTIHEIGPGADLLQMLCQYD